MKRSPFLAALIAALLLLPGCSFPALFTRSEPGDASDGSVIYRVAADRSAPGGLIETEAVPLSEAEAQDIGAVLAAFSSPPRGEALSCALPAGVTVVGWQLDNGVVTLELSEAYLDLAPMDRTVAACCAALTLCRLDEVEAVTVVSGGETVFSGLIPEDALLTDTGSDPYVRQLRLYFADSGGRYLLSEYHSLTLDEDVSPERYVVEELLRGPNSPELQSALPAGTALLSCETRGGVCTVDLSAEFYDSRPETAVGERLAIYSLVDSLTALSDVDSVVILVEGRALDPYVFRSLSEPLSRYDEAIGPVSAPKGEFDATLYLPLPGLDGLAALPFCISESDYESRAEAVLTALLNAEEPGYPAVFPGSGSVTGLSVRGTSCVVDLSESFFVSLPDEARMPAVRAMAATLCDLPDISAVRFTVGGADAVFSGEDFSGPWRSFDDIDIE